MTPRLSKTAAILRPFLVAAGVALFLIEEVIWAGLTHLMAQLGRLPLVARLEALIRTLPPYPAMALFLLPVVIILPFNLIAGWLMAKGQFLSGLGLLLCAKFSGMAIWARLYTLCRPALASLRWFAALETMILRWKAWTHALLDQFEPLQRAKMILREIMAALKNWVSSRL